MDFVYETNFHGYNFKRFKTDDDIVQKVRSGKGDETTRFKDLGKVLYVQIMFGGVTPKTVE